MNIINLPTNTQLDAIIGASRPIPAEKWRHAYNVTDVEGTLRDGYAIQGAYEYGMIDLWHGPTQWLGMVHQWGNSTELVESDDVSEIARWFTETKERLDQ